MTPLPSNRQNIVNNYSNTSMHRNNTYNSPQKTPTRKEPYISWSLWFPWTQQHLVMTVYRNPTHMDQYLHQDSNHFITAKNSVFNTLAYRVKVVCSNQHTLQQVMDHIRKALLPAIFHLAFPSAYLQNSTMGTALTTTREQHNNSNSNGSNNKNISIMIPYTKELGEKLKKTCNSLGIPSAI